MDKLLTTKQVQDLLKVDRTTIYRMLNDGRLNGIKVGQQWRFPSEEVEDLLSGTSNSGSSKSQNGNCQTSSDVLPVHCIQAIQDVFAELAEVGSVTTKTDGEPITELSNCNPYCQLIQNTESGRAACIESWKKIAQEEYTDSEFPTCHAGLRYTRAPIEIDNTEFAQLIAGQFLTHSDDSKTVQSNISELADKHHIDKSDLEAAHKTILQLDEHIKSHLSRWLERVAHTFEEVGSERSDLLGRLKQIASMSMLDN